MQIAIIGLGLIGGSLAKALKENTEHTVIGFDRDENTLLDALSLGAIDSVGSTSLLENADVVYVCLYPADVVRFVEENAPHFKEGCIVTDVCGIKNQVCGKLTEIAKNYPFVYVGGHPMAAGLCAFVYLGIRDGFSNHLALLFTLLFAAANGLIGMIDDSAKLRKAPQIPSCRSQKAWALAPSNTARSKSTTV